MVSSWQPPAVVASAVAVAALRAASAGARDERVRNPDYLAEQFIAPKHRLLLKLPRALLRRAVEWIVPGGYCYFLARARFFDDVFVQALRDGVEQFVVLGAGFDTRAHRYCSELAERAVFEVDLPTMQGYKRQRLAALGIPLNERVVYVPGDFRKAGLGQLLPPAGFDPMRRSLFLLEGVSYYLPPAKVEGVLAYPGRHCAPGASVVWDYALASFVAGDTSTYGSANMARWLKKNHEPFLFGVDPPDLPVWLSSLGLALREHLREPDIVSRYLFDSRGQPVGRPLGYLCFAHCCNNSR